MKNLKNIAWFKELSKNDLGIAGGKGCNLGEMFNARFPIPPGFVVTASAFKHFLEETKLNKKIYPILNKIEIQETAALEKTAKEIQELILDQEMPEDIKNDIIYSYENMDVSSELFNAVNSSALSKSALNIIKAGREIPFVAVRSSATAEDLPEASFAGQQETYLNIKGKDNLIRAVQRCWASLFTARAIYYRTKNNFPHEKVLIAVVIQKMVDSDSAGVIFTINPTTNNQNEIVIEGAFGLGESVVGGQVTPDHYVVNKDTLQIKEKKINLQMWAYKRDEFLRRTVQKELTPLKGKEQKVSDDLIVKLADLARRIERHYQKPQDIEFAIENNKPYIVQARAVTTEKKIGNVKKHTAINAQEILSGLGASPGIGTGMVKLVHSIEDLDKIKKGDILVTKMTNPDYVVSMQKAAAIVTDEGGLTAHAAIVSREMGIPCVVGTIDATVKLKENDFVTVDGTNGKVYKGKVEGVAAVEKKEYEFRETKTKIYMNLGEPEMIDNYKNLHFDGIGLMRLEFVIASQIGEHPLYLLKIGQQDRYINGLYKAIKKVASTINPKPLVVRFSDFKTNEYRDLKGGEEFEPHEDNPMLGWRGVSRYVSPEFIEAFKLELEAIKKVREEYKNVHVMLPFVRNVEEVKKVLEIMKENGLEKAEDFEIYLMAEVPSFSFLARDFAELDISGCSIGSNDLTQGVLCVDRDSAMLGKMNYFDERNPAVTLAMRRIIQNFIEKGKKVSICGQAPSQYKEIVEFLLKNHVTSISVNPDVVDKVRFDVSELEKGGV
ncbi:MAG: phosphoenolpyruvate synthase [Candidatus Nanoarchaeia archaeon]|nr:phosphoenolpyruvate synthase [Candidatus Nanoarchaeia archaeon]MDD5588050.1 phosphoenolpyruvate synthase [Candidatus Nanoarchaeia archaeon]